METPSQVHCAGLPNMTCAYLVTAGPRKRAGRAAADAVRSALEQADPEQVCHLFVLCPPYSLIAARQSVASS